ncbi:MAG TPA: GyrI-like domain-containing protein [Puia sp.]|jgi:predicted transcriptional regulator YdeE
MVITSGFKLIGLSIRTTNKDNKAVHDVGNLWERFFSEKVFEKIPNKQSKEILSIYTDYESDYTGEYTAIIGVAVATLDEVPEGLIRREFRAEMFQTFLAKGEMPKAVASMWSEIWRRDKELNRKYTYDFEVYGEKSQQGANSEVEIFLAIK